MSTPEITRPVQLINENQEILKFVTSDGIAGVTIDWLSGLVLGIPNPVAAELSRGGFAFTQSETTPLKLTALGCAMMSKLLIDWRQLIGSTLENRYEILKILASGSESVTYLARHVILGSSLCVKVIRPGKTDGLRDRVRKLSEIRNNEILVLPTDYFLHDFTDINENVTSLACVVFPYVDAPTFEAFLDNDTLLTPFFVLEFLAAMAIGLAALEEVGIAHGDLHERNILCKRGEDKTLDVKIIDIGVDQMHSSEYGEAISDLRWLKRHLGTVILKTQVKRMSLQKHLGASTFELLKYIFSRDCLGFREILSLIADNDPYKEFRRKQEEFILAKFAKIDDSALSLLRHEEISDPSQARDLFMPYMPLFRPLSKFGSAILYGHRGSGKSSYLAALAYVPKAHSKSDEEHSVDHRKLFGIFFACRQGEFKQFNSNFVEFTPRANAILKHILILKVIRKTIGVLRDSVENQEREVPTRIDHLVSFLSEYVKAGVDLVLKRVGVKTYHNLHATLLRNEIQEIDSLFANNDASHPHRIMSERDLVQFFEALRSCEPDLATAQFIILFDDAGSPNVPPEAQKVLNELVKSSNSVFCVKVSTERFAYTKECADGKSLEDTHDYIQFDVSNTLRIHSKNRREIERHFEVLMQRRLSNYKSSSIKDYLGDEPVKSRDLVSWLAGEKRASTGHYAGWQMVWQLADRTPRHLLEMVAAVFNAGNIDKDSEPKQIDLSIQNEAIISYSTRKLRALSFIPGAYGGKRDKRHSVGTRLIDCATAFGKVAQHYLHRGRMKTESRVRYYEVLAIELDDSQELSEDSKELLNLLIRYAVFDDNSLTASRDDQVRKPIYIVNRIYCPALHISYRREMHWRLSTARFDGFLNSPLNFVHRFAKENSKSHEEDLISQREFDFNTELKQYYANR